ncbi:MAG: uroporphyrinogen decarboxylase [Gammaproteobacteria bacterium]|nr:uroporphyrinogen decarboxylase [Gammaproteobacteria bacterium]
MAGQLHLRNDRLLRALRREAVDRTPIWIMRQAGRYLPEYRATRARAGDFLALCKTPELACEATLQPIQRFDLDAAILFSDILTIPDAMGLGLSINEGEGPRFGRPLNSANDIQKLGIPDPDIELRYVLQAVRFIKAELAGRVPLIGFSGSPWTLATYMVEGGTSKDFMKIRSLMYADPKSTHVLLTKLSDAIADYLNAQIVAGVDAVMLFDTWGGVLTARDYHAFSLQYMQKILMNLKSHAERGAIPTIVFTKGGGQWLEAIAATGCDAIGIDWTTGIGDARRRVGAQCALQGNLDPAVLSASSARIREEVELILAEYGAGSGHIFNLGHGIHPTTDPDRVAVLVDAVHELSRPYHGEISKSQSATGTT